MEPYKVLIVGGGPAGLAAGIVLGQAGIPTLIAERQTYPVDKACGEGIMPTGVAALRRLGAAESLDPSQFSPFRGIRYISASGHSASADFREGPGWGVRRTALSAALLARAEKTDCLDVRSGVRVQPMEHRTGLVWAQVGEERLAVRLLIGADGLHSGVRRWAGLEQSAPIGAQRGGVRRYEARRYGARQHFAVTPWTDKVEVYWNIGIEAYVTPTGPQQVGAAFLWDAARFRPPRTGQDLIPGLLELFPALENRLRGRAVLSQARAAGPLFHAVPSPVGEGVLLLGDSAGYIDALTGEGLSLALQAACLLERTVAPLLAEPGTQGFISAAALAPFQSAYARLYTPYARMAHLALYFSRQPRLLEAAVRILDWQPRIFARLLSANMGRD